MNTDRWDRLSALFEQALAVSPDERKILIDRSCADDPELRYELESLLAAHDKGGMTDEFGGIIDASLESWTNAGAIEAGQTVSHYQIVEKLGAGGMGVVYKARDTLLDRPVALKFLPPHMSAHDEIKERFFQEARAASALDHTNICTIHEIGETESRHLFIAMAFYEGETLKQKISRGPLPVEEAIDYALQMTEGLEHAHDSGIVHRDVKPANVVVTRGGKVKLLDFGIAKMASGNLTKPGSMIGTTTYMSPEQAQGLAVDRRSDLWSLGVVLYEMLTGKAPFRADHEPSIIYKIIHEMPEPVRELRPEISTDLEQIVERLLRKHPGERFQTMVELHDRLFEAMAEDSTRQRFRPEETDASLIIEPFAEDSSAQEDSHTWPFSTDEKVRMVGREEECVFLHERLDAALKGNRKIVFVSGEAGIGKTTLLDTFLRKARNRATLCIGHGQCLEHRGAGEAYMPVLEAFGRICKKNSGKEIVRLMSRQAPTWLVQMPWLIDASEFEALQPRVIGATKDRMLREMVEFIESLTARIPLVLILEDLHWSDYSTVDLITSLARRQEPARLLLIGTYRPADVKRNDHPLYSVTQELTLRGRAEQLAVSFLDETAVRDYLEDRFPGSDLPAALAPLLHQRTDGNALFMDNLVDAWITRGNLVESNGSWSLQDDLDDLSVGVPDTLRQLIEQKIPQLDPDEQSILEAASVAGNEFSAAAVAAGVGMPEEDVETRCDALARHSQFLTARGFAEWPDHTIASRYEFIHSLYQEVLYDRVAPARRVRLHRQIGARLEKGYGDRSKEHAAELAAHFVRGRDADRAINYLHLAAQQAIQRSAHAEALDLLKQGLQIIEERPDLPQRAQCELSVQSLLAPALVMTKGWVGSEAENALLRARDLCHELGDTPQLISVQQGLASLYEVRGEYRDAESIITQQLREQDGSEINVKSHELLACSTFHQGAFRRSLEHAERGLTLFDPQRSDLSSAGLGVNPGVACSGWAALALWFLGYPDRAMEQLERSLHLAQMRNHHYSLSHAQEQAAIFFQCRRQVDAAGKWADDTFEFAVRQGIPFRVAVGTILRGWAMAFQGKGEAGVERIRHGIQVCDQIGAKMDRPYYLGLLAEAYGSIERFEEAIAALDEALATVRTSRAFFYEAELHRLKGATLLASGENAEPSLLKALDVARRQSAKSLELRAALDLSRLMRQRGDVEEANALLAGVYNWFTEGFDTPDLLEAKAMLG